MSHPTLAVLEKQLDERNQLSENVDLTYSQEARVNMQEEDDEASLLEAEETTPLQDEKLDEIIQITSKAAESFMAKRTIANYEKRVAHYNSFAAWFSVELQDPSLLKDATSLGRYTPLVIQAFLMYHCDKPQPHSEYFFQREAQNQTLSYGNNLRAALGWFFVYKLNVTADAPYQQVGENKWVGNPLKADKVQKYMKGLRRRWVREGLSSESVRAIDDKTLKITPFVLYYDRTRPHLDIPVLFRAWILMLGIREGYLFRPFNSLDQVNADPNVPLSYKSLLDKFRYNLEDIQAESHLYDGIFLKL
ncbi:hypothetical protein KEM56_001991 [Ascosphaera pollenicola]|nr:hypothetical protein KEM56_001991 [Ascosphaera pollenicola]